MVQTHSDVRLGLRENWAQFSLLVVVNGFVGGMVGLERTLLPALAEDEFELAAKSAVLSFIVVFGVSKALTNYFAGHFSERYGRKALLVWGWVIAAPVPFFLMWAPSWTWVLFANGLLGVSQGLTWSMTVVMKIDLAGPQKRGLAMGFNEFAGYLAVAGAAWATGEIAARYTLRPEPFYLGVVFVTAGLLLSLFIVRDTSAHMRAEAALNRASDRVSAVGAPTKRARDVFIETSLTNPELSSSSQAGLVNNLADGMAWGLFPLFFAAQGLSLAEIGILAAIYPAVWGVGQLGTGGLSDRMGRKGLIVGGMWLQALAILLVVQATEFMGDAVGAGLMGLGTAMVYPTLLASIADVAGPAWRASAVGVYRLWRDLGYAVGALASGIIADAYGLQEAMVCVAGLTALSGTVVAFRSKETLKMPVR